MVTPTPLQLSDRLSAITGAQVYLKREDLQIVRSYKLRGAYNLLVQLTDDGARRRRGVLVGGQPRAGLRYACRTLGVHGRVYVPAKTPRQKRDRIRYHGGEFIELIVGGDTYDDAAEAALDDVANAPVRPWSRRSTTCAPWRARAPSPSRSLDQLDSEPDLVVVPVGGGGCIAGITTYLAERTDNTSVLGVEPAGAAAMMAALAAGEPVTLDDVDQFVDGAAVRRAGDADLRRAGGRRRHGVDHHGRRGRGVHRDARPLPERGHHRRARGRAVGGRRCWTPTSSPGRRWSAWSRAATTTCPATARCSSARWCTSASSTTSWWTSRRSPARCAASSTTVLGPNDDITLFEYVKRNNRETGEALVGIELGSSADLDGLLARMRATELHVETLKPGSPAYRYLLF